MSNFEIFPQGDSWLDIHSIIKSKYWKWPGEVLWPSAPSLSSIALKPSDPEENLSQFLKPSRCFSTGFLRLFTRAEEQNLENSLIRISH